MDIERFKQLWQETINAVSYEFRLQSKNGLVDAKKITDFYKYKIVDDLWFTDGMACDYNQWIALNIGSETAKRKIHNVMYDVKITFVRPVLAYVLFSVGMLLLVCGIIISFIGLIPFGIVLMTCGLAVSVGGLIVFLIKHGLTDFENVKTELTRVGYAVERFLDGCDKLD